MASWYKDFSGEMNYAFLMKLGWCLLCNDDVFWVKMVRGKYFRGSSGINALVSKPNGSVIWRGLVSVAHLLHKGSFIAIGNNHVTSF